MTASSLPKRALGRLVHPELRQRRCRGGVGGEDPAARKGFIEIVPEMAM